MPSTSCPLCGARSCICTGPGSSSDSGITVLVAGPRTGPPSTYKVARGVYPGMPAGGSVRLNTDLAEFYGLKSKADQRSIPSRVARRLRANGVDPAAVTYASLEVQARDLLLRKIGATADAELVRLGLAGEGDPDEPEAEQPPPPEDPLPKPGARIGIVLAWVQAGDPPVDRARRALEVELVREAPRASLVEALQAIVAAAEEVSGG